MGVGMEEDSVCRRVCVCGGGLLIETVLSPALALSIHKQAEISVCFHLNSIPGKNCQQQKKSITLQQRFLHATQQVVCLLPALLSTSSE